MRLQTFWDQAQWSSHRVWGLPGGKGSLWKNTFRWLNSPHLKGCPWEPRLFTKAYLPKPDHQRLCSSWTAPVLNESPKLALASHTFCALSTASSSQTQTRSRISRWFHRSAWRLVLLPSTPCGVSLLRFLCCQRKAQLSLKFGSPNYRVRTSLRHWPRCPCRGLFLWCCFGCLFRICAPQHRNSVCLVSASFLRPARCQPWRKHSDYRKGCWDS